MKLPAAVEAWAQFAADGGTKRADAEFVAREVARECWNIARGWSLGPTVADEIKLRFGPFDTPRVERRVRGERRVQPRTWLEQSTNDRRQSKESADAQEQVDPAVSRPHSDEPASAADQWPSDDQLDRICSNFQVGMLCAPEIRSLAKQRRELRERAEKAEQARNIAETMEGSALRKVAKLRVELAAAKADAERSKKNEERYLWLRDGPEWPATFSWHDSPEPLEGAELDNAIDAALATEKR